MKTTRYIIMLAAAFCALSCSQDTEVKHGKGDAVIGFAKSSYTFKETAGVATIPVAITGTPKDYPLTFDIKVEAVTSDKTVDEMFLFTQTSDIKFNGAVLADSTYVPVNIEFKVTDDKDINDDRYFKISLVNVKGAKLGEISEAEVIIKDNDNNPYEKLWGDWTCNCVSSSGATSWPVSLCGGFTAEEEEANADKVLVAWGFGGQKEDVSMYSDVNPLKQPAWYINIDIEAFTVAIQSGTRMADIWSFTGIDEDCIITAMTAAPGSTSFDTKYQIKGTISKDLNTITFEKGASLQAAVYGVSGTLYGYWYRFSDLVLTRN